MTPDRVESLGLALRMLESADYKPTENGIVNAVSDLLHLAHFNDVDFDILAEHCVDTVAEELRDLEATD